VPVIGGVSLACGLDGTLAVMAPVQGKGMAAVRAPGGAWSTPGDAIILENFGDTYNMNWDVALKPGTTNAIGLAVWYDKSKMFGWDGAAVQQLDVTGKFEFMAQIHDNMAGGGLVAVHFGKNAPGDDPLYWTRYSGAFLGPELITANASVHSTRFNAATSPDGKTTHVVWVQRDTPTEPLGTVSNMCDIRTK
jgi:hypothetical protein